MGQYEKVANPATVRRYRRASNERKEMSLIKMANCLECGSYEPEFQMINGVCQECKPWYPRKGKR